MRTSPLQRAIDDQIQLAWKGPNSDANCPQFTNRRRLKVAPVKLRRHRSSFNHGQVSAGGSSRDIGDRGRGGGAGGCSDGGGMNGGGGAGCGRSGGRSGRGVNRGRGRAAGGGSGGRIRAKQTKQKHPTVPALPAS